MPSLRLLAAAALASALLTASPAPAADFFVNPATGVDDLALADGSEMQPWRTLTFAIEQVPDTEAHVLHLAAGEYSEASGERLPIRLPVNVSLEGDPDGGSLLIDERVVGAPTVLWFVVGPDVLDATNVVRNLAIERRTDSGPVGRGLAISARSTTATPVFENLRISGNEAAVDLLADGDTAETTVSPVLTNCVLTGNQFGLLATAYTYSGASTSVDPVLTNTVLSDNADGAVFETGASYYLGPGSRRNATSSAVVEHATLAGNIGSGLVLDDTNLGFGSAGPVRPVVRNSILSAALGDYAVSELSTTSFPETLSNNLMEPSPLGFYLEDGLTPLLTIDEVNAKNGADGNFAATPLFARDVVPSWRLRADSPGVDSALPSAVATDFEGDARPSDTDGDGTPVSEVGIDEAPHCAVTTVLAPDAPEPRCGVFGPLLFDAGATAITEGFPDCSAPLEFQWFFDGSPIPGETGTTFSATPDRTGVYAVRAWCPDDPQCYDAVEAPVIVHELPTVDAGTGWQACIAAGASGATIDLAATANAPEGAEIESWDWTTSSPFGAFLGGATDAPILEISGYDDFAHLPVEVSVTVTDTNGCTATDTTQVQFWRAPRVSVDGPLLACMSESDETALPLTATVETPAGSVPVSYEWSATFGRIDDPSSPTPSLIINNLPFTLTSQVSVTVVDDQGCATTSEPLIATFHPSPTAQPGGPYQLEEDPGGTTSFLLDGSESSGGTGALAYSWTSDIGTFVPPSADTPTIQLDVANTGADQNATVCLTVVDENACPHQACTVASVKATPIQPPNDVGGTLRIAKSMGTARFSWSNAPIDATHDLADSYELWQTSRALPDLGGWTLRTDAIPPRSGITVHDDAALLDVAGEDRLYLKVVARNAAGASCVTNDPPRVTLDPDCLP